MTTKVRVEKASAGVYVMVQVQVVNQEGKWVNEGEPYPLLDPAQQIEHHIHQNKRLIVSELQLGNA